MRAIQRVAVRHAVRGQRSRLGTKDSSWEEQGLERGAGPSDDPAGVPRAAAMATHCLACTSGTTPPFRTARVCLPGYNYSIGIIRRLHKQRICRLGFWNRGISLRMEVGRWEELRDPGPSARRQPSPPERHRCFQSRQGCLGRSLVPRAAPGTEPGCRPGPEPARPGEGPRSPPTERRRVRGARVHAASFFPSQSGLGGGRGSAWTAAPPFGSVPAEDVRDGRPALHVRRCCSPLFQGCKTCRALHGGDARHSTRQGYATWWKPGSSGSGGRRSAPAWTAPPPFPAIPRRRPGQQLPGA